MRANRKAATVLAALCTSSVLTGCLFWPVEPAKNVGGLQASDFQLISQNGFDPQDNDIDVNDYAWSMEYFQPDGQQSGHVYVGTGNDMIGQIYQAIGARFGEGEPEERPTHPPEIRRYRPDLAPTTWERVFDYRDVDEDLRAGTFGFRFTKTYRAQCDDVNYLYATSTGRQAALWRTSDGGAGTWELVWLPGQAGSIRWMEEHDGLLYLGTGAETGSGDMRVGEIWATDGAEYWPVMDNGFGNPDNVAIVALCAFNGWLYAGTLNSATGYEIWKLAGPDNASDPIQIVSNGGPDANNESAITPGVFAGHLYWGNMLNPAANVMAGFKAADIIRIDTNDNWETVIGPDSLSGLGSGFDHWPNAYIWSMVVHEGWFYVGTYDQLSAFTNMLWNMPRNIKAFSGQLKRANLFEWLGGGGADLYKTQDGLTWYPVTRDGFGDVGNQGLRVMKSVGDDLYIGTTNPFDGLEIWRGSSSAE
jgi:hypothetical protein